MSQPDPKKMISDLKEIHGLVDGVLKTASIQWVLWSVKTKDGDIWFFQAPESWTPGPDLRKRFEERGDVLESVGIVPKVCTDGDVRRMV